jgi:hypothetical protein
MTEQRAWQNAPIPQAEPEPEPVQPVRPSVPRRAFTLPRGIGLAWLVLLIVLAVAMLVAPTDRSAGLALANPDDGAVSELRAVLGGLPDEPIVVVGMDADLGTYPEIRPAARAAFDDLLRSGASLAFVSVTAEGRAIAAAEVERLRVEGAGEDALLDLGYVAGVEAGLVRLVGSAIPSTATGPLADAIRERGGRLDAFDMALLVGGTDVGPRTWIEQVATRLSSPKPMVAIAPTFMQPELTPYLRSGQLAALIATVRDVAAYDDAIAQEGLPAAPGEPPRDHAPSVLAMLAGMIAAVLVLARQLLGALPALGRHQPREPMDEEQP